MDRDVLWHLGIYFLLSKSGVRLILYLYIGRLITIGMKIIDLGIQRVYRENSEIFLWVWIGVQSTI